MLDGSPAARRLLNAASDGARSEAERLLIKLLRDHGITGWKANLPAGGYKVDVTSPAQKVAIENRRLGVSQWPRRLRNDRKRQNIISMLGWQILRFTWLD